MNDRVVVAFYSTSVLIKKSLQHDQVITQRHLKSFMRRVIIVCLSAGEQPHLARALSGVLRLQDVATSAQQLLHQKQRDLL